MIENYDNKNPKPEKVNPLVDNIKEVQNQKEYINIKEVQKMAQILKPYIFFAREKTDRLYGVKIFFKQNFIALKIPDVYQQHSSEDAYIEIIPTTSGWTCEKKILNGLGGDRSDDFFRIIKQKNGEYFRINDEGEFFPVHGSIPSQEEYIAMQKEAVLKKEQDKAIAEAKKLAEADKLKDSLKDFSGEKLVAAETLGIDAKYKAEQDIHLARRAKEFDDRKEAGEQPVYYERGGFLEWEDIGSRTRGRVISRDDYIVQNYF